MFKAAFATIAVGLGLIAAPSWAKTAAEIHAGSGSASDKAAIATASELIARKQPAQGLEALAPVLARFDAQVAEAKARGMVFCGPTMMEAVLYAAMPGTQKKDGVVLGPEVCDAYFVQSYALVELGRKPEALAALQKLTALAPMHAHYFVELGFTYRINGQDDKAMEAYRAALGHAELAEDEAAKKRMRAAANRGIGYMLIEARDLEGAEKAYRESLKDDPESEIARNELQFIAEQRQH
ncbi:tetratricopeptide repeat protein [Novosphingobium soli]|uniref:Tetratricopeptide repeat protein n=1 Tax=Novosphingobium soli TaxID=574956 RepID=A0ABV6D160_9SPHN